MSDEKMRFADRELQDFHGEFRQLATRFDERVKVDDSRHAELLRMQEQTAQSVQQLTEKTEGIIQLHRDFQGVARVGMSVQKFMMWVAKFGFVGTAIVAILAWIIHFFDKAS
jgi:hypothetical protein